MAEIKVLSWNVGGGKALRLAKEERDKFKQGLNYQLRQIIREWQPDIIALQEIVRYGNNRKPIDLIKAPSGYFYKPSIAVDSERQTSPHKWQQTHAQGDWEREDYLGLGSGILWRQSLAHSTIWNSQHPKLDKHLLTEEVHLDLGLYTGDRDTEPRLAVVAHFVFQSEAQPLDMFLVNVHLTTLKGEREGKPAKDDEGSMIRLQQIDIILKGIVSRYNEWRSHNKSVSPPIWILAGDFNCIPESPEYDRIVKSNFIDLTPEKGTGTKASGLSAAEPTITLDYIFAGQTRSALNLELVKMGIRNNPKPWTHIAVSDHFPLFARLPVSALIPSLGK